MADDQLPDASPGDHPTFGDLTLVPAHDKNILDLMDMYTCTIAAKSCSTLMTRLSTAAPLADSYTHARRVRKGTDGTLDILLTPVHLEDALGDPEDAPNGSNAALNSDTAAAEFSAASAGVSYPQGKPGLEALPEAVAAAVADVSLEVKIARVPRFPPHTKADAAAWSAAYWPVSLRPLDKRSMRDRAQLSPGEIAAVKKHMAAAVKLAAALGAGRAAENACLIVDPATDSVVGAGVDCTHAHPLQHAVMVAVEAVASWQRRTFFGEEEGPQAQQADKEEDEGEEGKRRRLNGGIALPINARQQQQEAAVPETASGCSQNAVPPYLCTGYDCYVVQEPCAMCAMALVHSRLRRVIFCCEDSKGGALGGSGLKLHSKRTLNHHYIVFRLQLKQP